MATVHGCHFNLVFLNGDHRCCSSAVHVHGLFGAPAAAVKRPLKGCFNTLNLELFCFPGDSTSSLDVLSP
jgi:hypothetical protein